MLNHVLGNIGEGTSTEHAPVKGPKQECSLQSGQVAAFGYFNLL